MERERIERLAMDEAVGELTEDAVALLHAWLTEHPQAKQWVQETQLTCDKVRTAVERKTAAIEVRPERAVRVIPLVRRGQWLSLARWAAVVTLALLLGLEVGRQSHSGPPTRGPAVPTPAVHAQQLEWVRPAPGSVPSFWQAKAVALLQAKPQADSIRDARENLWERYRQHIKER
jgi:hypothetical protein